MNPKQDNRCEIVKETMEHLSQKQSDELISSVSYSIKQIPKVAIAFAVTAGIMVGLFGTIFFIYYLRH